MTRDYDYSLIEKFRNGLASLSKFENRETGLRVAKAYCDLVITAMGEYRGSKDEICAEDLADMAMSLRGQYHRRLKELSKR